MTSIRKAIESTLAGLILVTGVPAAASIVGGKAISITEAPWQLLVEKPTGEFTCGATWIGGRWALCAAHCFTATGTYSVHAGVTKASETSAATRIAAKRVIIHPDYPGKNYDLAVMELAADITSPLAKPITYAVLADSVAGLTDSGVTCRVTGWGKLGADLGSPDSLHMVISKIHSHLTQERPAGIPKRVIRISGADNTGPCNGDSGGPFVVPDATGKGWLLAGVVSTGSLPCATPAGFSNFTRLSAFTDWIKQNTGGLAAVPSPHLFPLAGPVSFQSGRMRLTRQQNLDIQVLDLSGSLVGRSHGVYSAGEHPLPLGGRPSGTYLLRVKSEGGDVRGLVGISR